MKAQTLLLTALATAGCATPMSYVEPPVTMAPTAPAAAPIVSVVDYTYQLLTPKNTGLTQVFDDGTSTFLKFESEAPIGLMLFDENGRPIPFAVSGASVMVSTVRTGWLIRTARQSSYAQANSPLRTAQIESFENAASPTVAALPAELAAARADVLSAQSRLAGLSAELELQARGEGRMALEDIQGELQAIRTRLNGIDATLIRTHFGFGSAELSLSANARETLIEAAQSAERVRIEGGADSVGAPAFNTQLALKRANAVEQLLLEGGIGSEKLSVAAVTREFIASNNTASGRAQNRRVDVIFLPAASRVARAVIESAAAVRSEKADPEP